MDEVRIITTSDGSPSVLNVKLDETYHSRHGALQESRHVFIKNGLDYLTTSLPKDHPASIRILEIGFGTGLNTLLTQIRSMELEITVEYTALDTYPLAEEIWKKLNYGVQYEPHFEKIHLAPWNKVATITPTFQLLKIQNSVQKENLSPAHYDLVYFDAFAPGKQPEMWDFSVLSKVSHSLKPAGVFVTYCAKGQVKRDLREAGLNVETLTGPPGKREMIRAHKQ